MKKLHVQLRAELPTLLFHTSRLLVALKLEQLLVLAWVDRWARQSAVLLAVLLAESLHRGWRHLPVRRQPNLLAAWGKAWESCLGDGNVSSV